MQEMTHKHTRELDRFHKEHRDSCTNCGEVFRDGMCAHLGYLQDGSSAVLCDRCSDLLKETVVRYHWQSRKFELPDPNEKLWRYMDLAKLISLISTKSLFFASADSFEDPFEGAKGIEARKEKWDSFYLQFFKGAILTAPDGEKKHWTSEELEAYAEKLLSQMDKAGEKERKNTYISCWHSNDYESEAMWKLYAVNVTNAIAIQTTAGKLYEALDRDPYIDIGKIKYIDYRNSFAPINGSYWYKRKAFEHEREVRAILHDFKQIGAGIAVPVDVETLIERIYISPYAPKWFEDVLRSVMEKYSIDKPLVRSDMLDKPFY